MRIEDRDAVLDMSRDDELAGEVSLYDQRRDYERAEFERAMDEAREYHAAQADLERRAVTDPAAALEVVQQKLNAYQVALLDGTESEKRGCKEELRQACARYNALSGRVTAESAA